MFETILGVLACLLLWGISMVMIAKPEWIWKLEHFLTVKDGEPTEWYITITRLTGVLFFFLCPVVLVILLL